MILKLFLFHGHGEIIFLRNAHLKRHIESKHEETCYSCAICGIGVKRKDKLKSHYKICKGKNCHSFE